MHAIEVAPDYLRTARFACWYDRIITQVNTMRSVSPPPVVKTKKAMEGLLPEKAGIVAQAVSKLALGKPVINCE